MKLTWTEETMSLINKLTPDIQGKAFDPDWFLLRQRLEQRDQQRAELERELQIARETLERAGYRHCDIAACNCGRWHDWKTPTYAALKGQIAGLRNALSELLTPES